MNRSFEFNHAVREQVPVLIGLTGPSGSGKTYTALRLATGMQALMGGDIYGIDTEAKRMLHYADKFNFTHVPFSAPFGALDYLEVLRQAVKRGAKIIVVDSMSHEHEGPGGLLDAAEEELKRAAGDDYDTWKADKFRMQSWIKPKAARRQLINGILQLNCNFVFCFRAKEGARPVKVRNPDTGRTKTEVVQQGFTPIAGDEFVYEMTANLFLPPQSMGVPQWQSDQPGEKAMMKLPEQFRGLLDTGKPMDEEIGRKLALWARGGDEPKTARTDSARPSGITDRPNPSHESDDQRVNVEEGGDDPEPPSFIFQIIDRHGEVHEMTDGARWANLLTTAISHPVPYDDAKVIWARNMKNIEKPYSVEGMGEFARRVEAAWRLRQPVKAGPEL